MKLRTSRMETAYIESGPQDGIPVVLLHGNLSTGRFFEHLFSGAPDRYRLIAPDMRGFGDSEPLPIDATRGLRDWADDTHALVEELGIQRPVHLAGWSTGGAAIGAYALDRPVASLTFIDPVSPYGYGGTRPDGTPCCPDWAGTGGGTGNAEFTQRLAAGDRSDDGPTAPRNVLTSSYWAPSHQEPRLEELLGEVLKSVTGDDGYPGDTHDLGALAGRRAGHARDPQRALGQVLQLGRDRRPRSQAADPVDPRDRGHRRRRRLAVGDGRARRDGRGPRLARRGGLPAAADGGPDPRRARAATAANGGRAEIEMFEGSGHFPPIDAAERWSALFFDFLGSVE